MISKRAAQISPSPTLSVTAKAKEMREQGIDVISLAAGEPDFDTPNFVKEAALAAIKSGFTKYTATGGIPDLKRAICRKFKADNGLDYMPANILVGNGAKQCLYNLSQVLIDAGDEAIIPVPYWVSYEEMVKLAGGACVFAQTKNFKLNAADLEKYITPKTKLLILNSPSNPSGAVYSREELEGIAGVCVRHNISVISDEIYEKLIYDRQHISIAALGDDIKKLTLVVNGVSKAYSMTGWRIGYCAGDEDIIKAATALQDHSTSNSNSIAQRAALAALEDQEASEATIAVMRAEYRKRRDYMVERLNKISGIKADVPDGAFYVFADVSGLYGIAISGSIKFCEALLEHAHVAAIPGAAFGDDRCVRFSYAASQDNIAQGMDRLEEFAARLQK